MSKGSQSEVLSGLPRSRPHRRSDKRPARPAGPQPASAEGTDPGGAPSAATASRTAPAAEAVTPSPHPGLLGTAVQAAAELAEIGLHAGARAIAGAVARLPRP